MSKRRSTIADSKRKEVKASGSGVPSSRRDLAPGASAPAASSTTPRATGGGKVPVLLILLGVFLVAEIAVIAVNYDKWRFRTVIKKAEAAMAEGRWDDALDHWDRHARNYPGAVGSVHYRTSRARTRIGAGDYEGALEDLQFILDHLAEKERSPDANLLGMLARCQAAFGQDEKALESYQQILRLEPSNAEARLFLGRRLLDAGRILEAARHLQAVPVEDYPDDLRETWQVIERDYLRKAEEATPGEASDASTSPAPAPAPAPPAAPGE